MPEKIWEIGASGWSYYKEICYDAPSHERKNHSYSQEN
jgi:hypothetical protein